MLRYRWLCERAREMGLDEDEWEDMSEDEEFENEEEMEIDEGYGSLKMSILEQLTLNHCADCFSLLSMIF